MSELLTRAVLGAVADIADNVAGRDARRDVTKVLLRELEPFRLLWVEEPVTPETDESLRHFGTSVPIATGERLSSRWQFKQLLHDGAGELVDYLHDAGPLACPDGHFHRSEATGLGIDIDEDAVRAAAGPWRLPDPDWRHDDGRCAEW